MKLLLSSRAGNVSITVAGVGIEVNHLGYTDTSPSNYYRRTGRDVESIPAVTSRPDNVYNSAVAITKLIRLPVVPFPVRRRLWCFLVRFKEVNRRLDLNGMFAKDSSSGCYMPCRLVKPRQSESSQKRSSLYRSALSPITVATLRWHTAGRTWASLAPFPPSTQRCWKHAAQSCASKSSGRCTSFFKRTLKVSGVYSAMTFSCFETITVDFGESTVVNVIPGRSLNVYQLQYHLSF
jgi:hypothetical protein